jgi:hypothetical protein
MSTATEHQLHPLQVDPKTGEPFLHLKKHHNIILTPLRHEDKPPMAKYLNDPAIAMWLSGPPFPYTEGYIILLLSHLHLLIYIRRS